jgi:putative heme-binding domain-containing protein
MILARLNEPELSDDEAEILLQSAVNIPSLDAAWGLLAIAQNHSARTSLRRAALERVVANADHRAAWEPLAADPKFAVALGELLDDERLRPLVISAAAKLHLASIAEPILAIANTNAASSTDREQALGVAVRLRAKGLGAALAALLDDPDPRVAKSALRGVVDVQDLRQLREILCHDRYGDEIRRSTADRLATSVGGSLVLLRLIEQGALPDDLKERAIAKAVKHADSNVRVLYEKFVPLDQRPQRLGQAIAADEILKLPGNSNRGREIFDKSSAAQCKSCHAVQGFGGSLGPELTKIGNKYERRALLETIIDPSKAIAPEFVPYLVETKSGQVYAGFLLERNDQGVVLKDVKAQLQKISTDEIESLVAQGKSLMPELVLSQITAQDAADLLAYLTSLK